MGFGFTFDLSGLDTAMAHLRDKLRSVEEGSVNGLRRGTVMLFNRTQQEVPVAKTGKLHDTAEMYVDEFPEGAEAWIKYTATNPKSDFHYAGFAHEWPLPGEDRISGKEHYVEDPLEELMDEIIAMVKAGAIGI